MLSHDTDHTLIILTISVIDTNTYYSAIRSIVYQNTAPDGPLSAESSKQLTKYLQTPDTKDIGMYRFLTNCFALSVHSSHNMTDIGIVYAKIVERIVTDKTRNEMIVRRAVNILKANLSNYQPSGSTLSMLDKFCLSIVTDNEQILRVPNLISYFLFNFSTLILRI